MKYIIASTAVTDEIRFADGKIEIAAGGAGIYALCGVKLWSDDVLLTTGVGADYDAIYGEWYDNNNISKQGLIIKDKKTPHNVIQYFENGERTETPLYGAGHYKTVEIQPEELAPYFKSAEGIYIFRNSEELFWEKILDLKKDSKAVVMWEIANDATYADNQRKVKWIASKIDILSINLAESQALLGTDNLDEIIREYQSWNMKLVFLRRGAEGSIMITPTEVIEVPSAPDVKVVDPTGGGNSSSGAVLCGFCEGKSLKECAWMGNYSAEMSLGQYGIPAEISVDMQKEARKKLERITDAE